MEGVGPGVLSALRVLLVWRNGALMNDLTDLPNIGPKLAQALIEAGIDTPAKLAEVGSVEAWWRVHPRFTCQHSLLALEDAIQGVPKSLLNQEIRERLRQETLSD